MGIIQSNSNLAEVKRPLDIIKPESELITPPKRIDLVELAQRLDVDPLVFNYNRPDFAKPYPKGLDPFKKGVFAPQDGWQWDFMQPETVDIRQVILQGTRYSGKSYQVVWDFLRFVGKGFGKSYNGLVIRRDQKGLEDLIGKFRDIIDVFFPDAEYKVQAKMFIFKTGEWVKFDQISNRKDYGKHHGHRYAWILVDELGEYPSLELFDILDGLLRDPAEESLPPRIRATMNPSGLSVAQIFRDYGLPENYGKIITEVFQTFNPAIMDFMETVHNRMVLFCPWWENLIAINNDKNYLASLERLRRRHSSVGNAWLWGHFDGKTGGMFSPHMDKETHFIEPFSLNNGCFRVFRAFDWGYASPFSVGWWAEALQDCLVEDKKGNKRMVRKGDLYLIDEWYGCEREEGTNNTTSRGLRLANEVVARKTFERDIQICEEFGINKVYPGPASADMWDQSRGRAEESIIDIFDDVYNTFYKSYGQQSYLMCDQTAHSRKRKWQVIIDLLEKAKDPERKRPAMFCFNTNDDWWEQMSDVYKDEKKPEDIDTTQPDHIADMTGMVAAFIGQEEETFESIEVDLF